MYCKLHTGCLIDVLNVSVQCNQFCYHRFHAWVYLAYEYRATGCCVELFAYMHGSVGSIIDISMYRDTCVRSIPILHCIAILRYIEYRMRRTSLNMYRTDTDVVRFDTYKNRRYRSIAQNLDIAVPTTDSSMPNIVLAYWYRQF